MMAVVWVLAVIGLGFVVMVVVSMVNEGRSSREEKRVPEVAAIKEGERLSAQYRALIDELYDTAEQLVRRPEAGP